MIDMVDNFADSETNSKADVKACIHRYMHTYIDTYIQTYIHTYIQKKHTQRQRQIDIYTKIANSLAVRVLYNTTGAQVLMTELIKHRKLFLLQSYLRVFAQYQEFPQKPNPPRPSPRLFKFFTSPAMIGVALGEF